jgi:hypothetical protein
MYNHRRILSSVVRFFQKKKLQTTRMHFRLPLLTQRLQLKLHLSWNSLVYLAEPDYILPGFLRKEKGKRNILRTNENFTL